MIMPLHAWPSPDPAEEELAKKIVPILHGAFVKSAPRFFNKSKTKIDDDDILSAARHLAQRRGNPIIGPMGVVEVIKDSFEQCRRKIKPKALATAADAVVKSDQMQKLTATAPRRTPAPTPSPKGVPGTY